MLPDCGGLKERGREGGRALYIRVGVPWRILWRMIHRVNHY